MSSDYAIRRHNRAMAFRDRRIKIIDEWKEQGGNWPVQSAKDLEECKKFVKKRERELKRAAKDYPVKESTP